MFKIITASLILLAFATQMFSGQFIKLDYYLNTAAYAKSCVNKTRPKMHCNGKCQMMKKMQQEEKKDQQNPERKTDNGDQVLSSRSFFYSLTILSIPLQNTYFIQSASLPADRASSVFRPPCC